MTTQKTLGQIAEDADFTWLRSAGINARSNREGRYAAITAAVEAEVLARQAAQSTAPKDTHKAFADFIDALHTQGHKREDVCAALAFFAPVAQPVQLAVQEPTAWFAFGWNNGPVPLELYGWDEKACKHAVLTYARADGWKGTVEGYLMQQGWTLRPVYTAIAAAVEKEVIARQTETAAEMIDLASLIKKHNIEARGCGTGTDVLCFAKELAGLLQIEPTPEVYNAEAARVVTDEDIDNALIDYMQALSTVNRSLMRRVFENYEARKATQQPVPAYDVDAAIDRILEVADELFQAGVYSDIKRHVKAVSKSRKTIRAELLAAAGSKQA